MQNWPKSVKVENQRLWGILFSALEYFEVIFMFEFYFKKADVFILCNLIFLKFIFLYMCHFIIFKFFISK
jgi:hypothetical protein